MAEPLTVPLLDEAPECWCCGESFHEDQLVRLGEHPEVGLCMNCALWVHRRARALGDEGRRGPGARGRRAVDAARERVIRSGVHDWPVLGAILRRIDRHLP